MFYGVNGKIHLRHDSRYLRNHLPPKEQSVIDRWACEYSMESATMKTIEEPTQTQNYSSSDTRLLYLYGTPPLILFCIISVAINIKILISVHWIRRPLSPTLYISLSLAGADAFSSTALGIGLVMNSFIPHGLELHLAGVNCFLLGLEAIRLASVIITVSHLTALAINHYVGILKPLQYISIMTHRNTTCLIIVLWVLPISFFITYFSIIENEGFQSDDCTIHTFLYRRKFRTLFSSLFFGPFVLMVCIYVHIFFIVKKHQASRLRFSRVNSSFRRGQTNELQNSCGQMARSVKAINTTLYILGSFVVGWMPGTLMYMLVCDDCLLTFEWTSNYAKFFVFNAINCLIILKTLVNPIIYAARMHEIKMATRRMYASIYECLGLTNIATDREIVRGLSSEDVHSHRQSLSRNHRLTNNFSIRHPRARNYAYTYTINNGHGRSSTTV